MSQVGWIVNIPGQLSWIANITFLPAAYLCKASILLFYFQITSRVFRFPWIAIWFVSVFVVIGFLVSTGVSVFICLPLDRQWYVLFYGLTTLTLSLETN